MHPYRNARVEPRHGARRPSPPREVAVLLLAVAALSALRFVCAWLAREPLLGEPALAAAMALLTLSVAVRLRLRG